MPLRFMSLRFLLALGLAAAPAEAATGPFASDSATIAFSADSEAAGADIISQCLTDIGLREAEMPGYLVQFSRAMRPRKTLVLLAARDAAAAGPTPRNLKRGRTAEFAALTVSEMSSGKVVLNVQVARKVSRKAADPNLIVRQLCAAIRQSAAEAGRSG
ncbi:MAG: hypothetical protein QM676_01100 [Novosphingobium sp.]